MLLRLMYASTARLPMTDKVLNAIHAQAALRNLKYGITGFLHYDGARFMQVLEGESATIDQLEANIRADQRHHDYKRLLREEITQRSFPNWSMQLLRVSSGSTPNTLRATINAPSLKDVAGRLSPEGQKLVDGFVGKQPTPAA